VGLFNIGYEKKDLPSSGTEIYKILGALSKSVGEDLGKYLGHICSFPEFTPTRLDAISYNIDEEKLKYKDEKSQRYFNIVFNGEGTVDLNFSLLLFLATINFLKYIFTGIVVNKPVILFKLKFITLYHLISSLTKLRDYYYPTNLLTDKSKVYIEEILKDKDLQFIKEQKELRNILIHYKITGVPETLLDPTTNLYGLIEYFFTGKTYAEMESILDSQIKRISNLFEEWINWRIPPARLSNWKF
jgi:hypothetical protein